MFSWLLCCKLIDRICMGLFLDSLFCSIDLCICFYTQSRIVASLSPGWIVPFLIFFMIALTTCRRFVSLVVSFILRYILSYFLKKIQQDTEKSIIKYKKIQKNFIIGKKLLFLFYFCGFLFWKIMILSYKRGIFKNS